MNRTTVSGIMVTLLLISMLTLAFNIQPVKAESITWTVDDDLQDCPDADFTKIQEAVNSATDGDTVLVYPGTYIENVDVNKSLTIKSEYGSDSTVVQSANSNDRVFEVTADYVNISGFTARGATEPWMAGIYIRSDYCNISHNTVSNNWHCIFVDWSSHNRITGNIASNNVGSGIWVRNDPHERGYNIIANNTCSNNNNHGIRLDSVDNIITNNICSNNAGSGISLGSSHGNTITNNTCSNNHRGISLGSSRGNTITNNNCSSNEEGIRASYSSGNNILSNRLNSHLLGIYLIGSRNQVVTDNRFENCGILIGAGLERARGYGLSCYNTHTIEGNTINGKPIYYYKDASGIKVPEDAGEVILANCINMTVENIDASGGSVGIELGYTSNSTISSNTILNNSLYGICLEDSNGNGIKNNTCPNNWYGILLRFSSDNSITRNKISNNLAGTGLGLIHSNNNKIHFNNFVDNKVSPSDSTGNVWDDGYPSGGNYWSDYEERYPYAAELDDSGIWDTPYVIDENNQDNYPLMKHWTPIPPPNRYSFTISVVGSGTTVPSPSTYYFDVGTIVDVAAIPDPGWMLHHWELDGVVVSSNHIYTVTLDTDYTLTAYFVEAPGTTIYVDPPSISANVGESFTVNINIREVENLYAYETRLGFDNATLEPISVEEGPFIRDQTTSPDGTVFLYRIYDDCVLAGCVTLGKYPGVSGSGTLFTVTFNVTDAGTSDLPLYASTLLDSVALSIPHTASYGYFYTPGSIPTPAFPDFSIKASPASLTIQQDNTDTSEITVTSLYGFDQQVQLSVPWVPPGVTATLVPDKVTPPPDDSTTSTLIVAVDITATPGSYSLIVTGTNGTLTHSVDITLEITVPEAPPQPVNLSPADGATDVSLTPQLLSSPPLQDVDRDLIPWEQIHGHDVTRVYSQWHITTILGDYSNPVYDKTILGLIGRYSFPEVWSNWVDPEVLDYEATYYWQVRHKDFRGVWSPWSDETSFTTRQFYPPEADFDYSPKNPKAGEMVELDASASRPGEAWSISYYRWDLDGDGDFDGLTTSPVIYYRWDKSGTYNVALEVVNWVGDRDTITKEITVEQNSWWERRVVAWWKRIFGPKGPTEEDLQRFEIIKRELRLEEFEEFYDSDTPIWVRDMQILTALKEKMTPEEGEITYEQYILQILHDMKLVDSYVNYSWQAKPEINEYFTNMAEVSKWAELGLLLGGVALEGLISAAGGSGVGIGVILMIPEVVEAGISLKLLYEILYERERWLFFNDIYDQNLLHLNKAQRDHLQALKDEYANPLQTRREEFKNEVREELRKILHYVLEKYKLWPAQAYQIKSPVELRVYDSQGNVVGLVDGNVNEEIAGSVYVDGTILIYPAADSYYFVVAGTEQGAYGVTAISVRAGEVLNFTATDIPISANAIHQYTVDWAALFLGEEGVTVQIDSDGDGIFEQTITADGELSYDEFMLQTATTIDFDPDTLNLESEGKWVTVYIELPEGYNVSQIDVSSIMLNDTVPALVNPAEIGDYDGDGVPDLMVKFNRQDLIAILSVGEATLTITGEVNGIPFEGSDTTRVIGK